MSLSGRPSTGQYRALNLLSVLGLCGLWWFIAQPKKRSNPPTLDGMEPPDPDDLETL